MILKFTWHDPPIVVLTCKLNEGLNHQFATRNSYLDQWRNIYQVVSILLDSNYTKCDTEILLVWFTDTGIFIEIEWMTVVSILNDIFVFWQVE